MKIAYLSTFYPYRGGIAQFNASLYRELEKSHQISAYTFSRQYPDLLFPGNSQYVSDNDPAEKIEAKRILDTINPLSYYSTAREINKFSPDILITKFWLPFFAPSLGKVARKLSKNCTKIAVLDNVIPHEKRPFDMSLIKYFLNSYDKFLVMSDKVKEDLLSLKPNADYMEVIHPLYNHFGKKLDKKEAREKLGINADKKVLLFFGFIRDYKGLDLLIDALAELPEEYHLIIAGESYGSFDKYTEQISKLGLAGRISNNVRYIDDSEVPVFFSASDICVLPYKSATQSGITAISFHFDLPILATDVGGLKEMIEPFGTGLIANEANPGIIKNKILEFFNSSNNNYFNKIQEFKKLASWEELGKIVVEMRN